MGNGPQVVIAFLTAKIVAVWVKFNISLDLATSSIQENCQQIVYVFCNDNLLHVTYRKYFQQDLHRVRACIRGSEYTLFEILD